MARLARKRPAAAIEAPASFGAAGGLRRRRRAPRRVTLGPAEHARIAEAVRGGATVGDLVRDFGPVRLPGRGATDAESGPKGRCAAAAGRAPRAWQAGGGSSCARTHARIAEAVRGGARTGDLAKDFGLSKSRAKALRALYGAQGAAPLTPDRLTARVAQAVRAGATRATLSAADHARVAEAVRDGAGPSDLRRDFGLSARRARELRLQYSAEGAAPMAPSRAPRRARRADAASTWLTESNRCFAVGAGRPPRPVEELSGGPAEDAEAPDGIRRGRRWMALGSWTFCPRCGRRNATGPWAAMAATGSVETAAAACPGGCDLPPSAMERAAPRRLAPRSACVDAGEWAAAVAEAEWVACTQCSGVWHWGKPVDAPPGASESGRVVHCGACASCKAAAAQPRSGTAKYYVMPAASDWPVYDASAGAFRAAAGDEGAAQRCVFELAEEEAASLPIIDSQRDYTSVRGGRAPTACKKKTSVVRARWRARDVQAGLPTPRARAAFAWLMEHSEAYRRYYEMHLQKLAALQEAGEGARWIYTAELLLRMPGVEAAARPVLCPTSAFGDSELRPRLRALNLAAENGKPSIKASFMRKLRSRCVAYQTDFPLFALLYDIALARQLSSLVAIAKQQRVAPDEAAGEMQNFSGFWQWEREKLEDVCRQMAEHPEYLPATESEWKRGLPNVFMTIAPAEWKTLLHDGMFARVREASDLTELQPALTLHLYHTITTLFEKVVLASPSECGFKRVFQYVLRIEFQGRGTLHVHVLAWVEFDTKANIFGCAPSMTGRSPGGTDPGIVPEDPRPLRFLEKLFAGSADAQCNNGHHNFLNYVTSYEMKGSDALQFQSRESEAEHCSAWRQTYRLLCKKAPLELEMTVEFATKPLMLANYRGRHLYAPLPRDRTAPDESRVNDGELLYRAYLERDLREEVALAIGDVRPSRELSYIQWARERNIHNGRAAPSQPRRGRGADKSMQALAVRFPFELLDNFVGAWCAMFLPHAADSDALRAAMSEGVPVLPAKALWPADDAAAGARFLKAALVAAQDNFDNDEAANPGLLQEVVKDMVLRGLKTARIRTFVARLRACRLLIRRIDAVEDVDARRRAVAAWDLRKARWVEKLIWSPEQNRVLDAVKAGVEVADANVAPMSRFMLVTGGPGTGKTSVVLQCAIDAASTGCRVLIACKPIGALVSVYRQQLPPGLDIVVETIHSSFKITRKADAQYVPPGRLRHFDLLVFDECSQPEDRVWREMRTALRELSPGPFVVFVGDFQQLQPIHGASVTQSSLLAQARQGEMRHVELQQRPFARCTDAPMLDFLSYARERQPTRGMLAHFFQGRRLRRGGAQAVQHAMAMEKDRAGKHFTFLTVTNAAARALNLLRLRMEFGIDEEELDAHGVPGDPGAGGGRMIFRKGMRLRLTLNIDKDRGFVNGCLGHVEEVLSVQPPVLVLRTTENTRPLVHYVFADGQKFMPCTYGWAMTIRRSQGSTLDMGAICFDRTRRAPTAGRRHGHARPGPRIGAAARLRRRLDQARRSSTQEGLALVAQAHGYAYVALSRFRTRDSVFLLGRIRATDWLPVGGGPSAEQTCPGFLSDSDASEDDMGAESEASEEDSGRPEEDAASGGGGLDTDSACCSDARSDSVDPALGCFSDWSSDAHSESVDPALGDSLVWSSDEESVDPAKALNSVGWPLVVDATEPPAPDAAVASAGSDSDGGCSGAASPPPSPLVADCPAPEPAEGRPASPPEPGLALGWDDAAGAWAPVAPIRHYWASEAGL
ncbi:unnamed protein product [Prorocentrum cordatum]|uniref:Helitron helicase-like domain-containing protein n=1 Tax=Prorocentrum cordatum TaxID=2364126 RepID=A0ABN9XXG0_9DINO|nr:unnamed protein product [Polarella glacialis]